MILVTTSRAVLLALMLAGCASRPIFPYETGAPPRPPVAGQKWIVRDVPLSSLNDGTEQDLARTIADHQSCVTLIAQELNAEDRARTLVHEKRHCAFQQHRRVDRPDGSFYLVWLP